jgi:thioredoxin 1
MHFPIHPTTLRTAVFLMLASCACLGQGAAASPPLIEKPFAPFEQWKELVLKGDADGLKTLYSTHPVAHIKAGTSDLDAAGEVRFWVAMKAKSMKAEILQNGSPQVQPGSQQVLFQAEIQSAAGPKEQTFYITEGQLWQQQDQQWRILVVKRTDASRLEQPVSNQKNIYPAGVDSHAEIKEALQKGQKEHKRVLVVFGANWCYDCHVLDLAFTRPDVAPVLGSNFEVVHVDIGQGDKNQDLMKRYEVPMDRGIPALAVLDGEGKLLYSQKNGEFEKARALGPEDLLAFLDKWKPKT